MPRKAFTSKSKSSLRGKAYAVTKTVAIVMNKKNAQGLLFLLADFF